MEDHQIESLCFQVLSEYPEKVKEYHAGKTGIIGMFAGEVMKKSNGTANPKEVIKILKQQLNE